MLFAGILILLYVVYNDARLLRSRDPELYHKVFRYKEWFWVLSVFGIIFAFLPIYLIRRNYFVTAYREYAALEHVDNEWLLNDAWGNVLKWTAVLMVTVICFVVVDFILPDLFDDMTELIFTSFIPSLFLIQFIRRTIRLYPGESFKNFIALTGAKVDFWKTILAPFLISLSLAYISVSMLFGRAVQPTTPLSQVMGATTSSVVMLIFILSAVLVAPLLEELIFRGYFYRVAERVKGKVFAVILISLVFALMHVGQYWGDWAAILMVGLTGFALTMLRAWSGSTVASSVGHYTYNIGVTVLAVIMIAASNPAFFEYSIKYPTLSVLEKEELLLESINSSPDFVIAYNDLAWLYAEENKNLDRALELVETALEADSQNDKFLDTKAEVLYRLGRVEEAIAIETGLIQRFPEMEFYRQQLNRFKMGFE